MKHEERIIEAFKDNHIERILIVDDGYDPPDLSSDRLGELMDFLESTDGASACNDAGLSEKDIESAKEAVSGTETESKILLCVYETLYKHFVDTRESRFDPGMLFQTRKGPTLDGLEPLTGLLKKCGDDVEVRYAGLNDVEEIYELLKPQVVFLDFYLSPDMPKVGSKSQEPVIQDNGSTSLLKHLLETKKADIPAIVLMSSRGVEDHAEGFRRKVKFQGGNPLALRFRFLQKPGVSAKDKKIDITHEAADALLDTAQGFKFGQVLQRALTKWREGADEAINKIQKEISDLEPKDFAYLFRFRLDSEGESMPDYLEWMFGESLRALVDENVTWDDDDFKSLDDPKLSEGIEGAFEGTSVPIAKIFHRIKIDERKSRRPNRYALGDIYVANNGKSVRTVVTPNCDLVVRKNGTKALSLLTMGGELQTFDQGSTSVDQFIIHNKNPYSLKWNPKDLKTYSFEGKESIEEDPDYSFKFVGTLRPLYAQEMQRQSLTDLSRVGLAVAPAMGIDASISAWLRVKKGEGTDFKNLEIEEDAIATILLERGDARLGHKVLLRRKFLHSLFDSLRKVDVATLCTENEPLSDKECVNKFLLEKSEDHIVNRLLNKGALTKDKGPLGTKFTISEKPDTKKGSPWLQFLLKLSHEAMEELLTIDPSLIVVDSG